MGDLVAAAGVQAASRSRRQLREFFEHVHPKLKLLAVGTVQPKRTHGNPALHATHERFLKEVGEPLGRYDPLVHLVQLWARSQITARHPRDGCWDHGSTCGTYRNYWRPEGNGKTGLKGVYNVFDMPSAKTPLMPEWYVYGLESRGSIFYIGIGRSIRASDRVRYVRYLMAREKSGKAVKWVLSNQVVAELLRRGEDVRVWYLHTGSLREAALAFERQEIDRLLSFGMVLANIQHNKARPPSAKTVVRSLLLRTTTQSQ